MIKPHQQPLQVIRLKLQLLDLPVHPLDLGHDDVDVVDYAVDEDLPVAQ